MQQKLIRFFLPQEAGAFGNNKEKNCKNYTRNWKSIFIFTENIYSACNRMEVVVFCKNFVE